MRKGPMDEAELSTLLRKQVGRRGVVNIVAGVQSVDGITDITAAAGIADPETGTAMTVDTPYLLASIAKTYTAAAIMRLYERDQLGLDDPIIAFLPGDLIEGIHVIDGVDHTRSITIRHLITQTSGLADYYEGKPRGGRSLLDDVTNGVDRALDAAQIMDLVRTLSPEFPPGADGGRRAFYADTNYQLLGAIIETVTGRSLADSYEDLVFAPLGLRHTYPFAAVKARSEPEPATVFMKDRAIQVPNFLSSCLAEGGLVSTLGESLTFLRGVFEAKLFDSSTLESMMEWNKVFFPIQYGYGLMRFDLPRVYTLLQSVPELIGHSGSTGSFALFCPSRSLYVAGTVNQLASPSRAFRLAAQIVNRAS